MITSRAEFFLPLNSEKKEENVLFPYDRERGNSCEACFLLHIEQEIKYKNIEHKRLTCKKWNSASLLLKPVLFLF